MAAYKRPAAERAPYIEEALHGAAEVPMQVLERVSALITRLGALEIPARFGSDLAVAQALAEAARAGALENVHINLDSIQDAGFKSSIEARLRAIGC
jgi:formiminotetrahydrofolate cyclodeaminase